MKNLFIILLFLSCFSCTHSQSDSRDQPVDDQPIITPSDALVNDIEEEEGDEVEIVFCLDATGSMSGLIGTAKEKIWSIVSEIAQDTSVSDIKLGMVFYRDRGDRFVTLQIDMVEDLDSVYTELLAFEANGGGDTPESLNQALHEAVHKMKWSPSNEIYKTIFVVGDCPPHMDYKNDVLYTQSCKEANEKGIVINTIKLGRSCRQAIYHFSEIAKCAQGKYLNLDQNATDYSITTPYDDQINEISKEIDDSRIYYGTESQREINYEKKSKSMDLYENSSANAISERSAFKSSKAGKKAWMGRQELLNDVEKGRVKVSDISEEQLPKELKNMSSKDKENYINERINSRKENENKLVEINKKRAEYIKDEKAKLYDTTSFSNDVVRVIKEQRKK